MKRGKEPAAAAARDSTVLCRLADVADGGSNGFVVESRVKPFPSPSHPLTPQRES